MSAIAGLAPEYVPDVHNTATPALPVTARVVDGQEWDRVVAGFDAVCQEQLYAFAVRRWPDVRQEPVLFEYQGRVVGGSLMMIQPLPLGLAKIAVSKWAPMLADARAPDACAIHAGMVEALIDTYARQRRMMLSILPRAATDPINSEYVALRARGFQRGSSLLFPNRYIVNLRLTDDEQRRSFQQAWRRQLNKAEKSDLTFEHGTPERLDDFKTLYSAMTDRKQFPITRPMKRSTVSWRSTSRCGPSSSSCVTKASSSPGL